jgi:hypothetical protein
VTALGVVVAAVIAWVENVRARRVGIWGLLPLGLWGAAVLAFPDAPAWTDGALAAGGVALLAIATGVASLADRWLLPAEPRSLPILRPWLPGLGLATAAAVVAGFGRHVAALLLAALASGWGAWLMVPPEDRPVPLAAVVLTLLVVPCLWLFVAIRGPEGLALSALPYLPISPAAERLLGLLLFAAALVLAGPWPFSQPVAGLLTAPVGAMLLTRLALPAVGAGLEHWRPAAFPLLVIGFAAAAFAGRVPALAVLGAFIGLASLDPAGVRGAGWLLVVAVAVALAERGARHATARVTIACVAWLGVLDVVTGGLRAEVVYTVTAAALAALGLVRAVSRAR